MHVCTCGRLKAMLPAATVWWVLTVNTYLWLGVVFTLTCLWREIGLQFLSYMFVFITQVEAEGVFKVIFIFWDSKRMEPPSMEDPSTATSHELVNSQTLNSAATTLGRLEFLFLPQQVELWAELYFPCLLTHSCLSFSFIMTRYLSSGCGSSSLQDHCLHYRDNRTPSNLSLLTFSQPSPVPLVLTYTSKPLLQWLLADILHPFIPSIAKSNLPS